MDPFIIRNLTYGIEDSILSTTGLILGIDAAGVSRVNIIITGLVLLFVEASSMAYGAFLSEESFLVFSKYSSYTNWQVSKYALTMFLSYAIAGLIPLFPYIIDVKHAYKYAIILTTITLFSLLLFIHNNIYKALIMTAIGLIILYSSINLGKYLNKTTESKQPIG